MPRPAPDDDGDLGVAVATVGHHAAVHPSDTVGVEVEEAVELVVGERGGVVVAPGHEVSFTGVATAARGVGASCGTLRNETITNAAA